MMKSIELRNLKTESIIIGLGSFALGVIVLYWASKGDMTLRISGAKLDKTTSTFFLYFISIGPILVGINLLIKYFSLLAYGEFTLTMETDKLVYPAYSMFKGFRKMEIDKSKIDYVKLFFDRNKPSSFSIFKKDSKMAETIDIEIIHPSVKPHEVVDKINAWLGH